MKNSLNLLERSVLDKVAQGETAALLKLRRQIEACIVKDRSFSGYGFFTSFVVPENIPRINDLNLKFGDVVGSIPGLDHGVGFLVYINNGVIDMLEGYSYDEPWPEHVEGFELEYTKGAVRDWSGFPLDLQ